MMTLPWQTGEWEVEDDRYAKRLRFGGGIGYIDNDEIDPIEQEANRELIKLTSLMAENILSRFDGHPDEFLATVAEASTPDAEQARLCLRLRGIITKVAESERAWEETHGY